MTHLKKFEKVIARRKRHANLRKHVGERSMNEKQMKAVLVPNWPEGTPKMSDYFIARTAKNDN